MPATLPRSRRHQFTLVEHTYKISKHSCKKGSNNCIIEYITVMASAKKKSCLKKELLKEITPCVHNRGVALAKGPNNLITHSKSNLNFRVWIPKVVSNNLLCRVWILKQT